MVIAVGNEVWCADEKVVLSNDIIRETFTCCQGRVTVDISEVRG